MKTIIYYATILLITFVLAYAFTVMEKRDQSNAKYWEQRQSECRSMGSDWDLNNKGKCVQFEMY